MQDIQCMENITLRGVCVTVVVVVKLRFEKEGSGHLGFKKYCWKGWTGFVWRCVENCG